MKQGRKPMSIETNQSKIKQFQVKGALYQAFEASLPLSLMDYREFEGRVKKLAFETGTVTLKQLQFAFARKYSDFADVSDPDSAIFKVLTSSPFLQKGAKTKNVEIDETEIQINKLLLLGLLYCKGNHNEKTVAFYDIL